MYHERMYIRNCAVNIIVNIPVTINVYNTEINYCTKVKESKAKHHDTKRHVIHVVSLT
jgi:hypothetical protein